ncbi:MAG: cysteine desulfurase family protein [Gammaproteobacteria bacterium]
MPRVYLDHNATTPVEPRVAEAMQQALGAGCGNPSSVHREGRMARTLLEQARARVAALADVEPARVVFCSGGTEADNLALNGLIEQWREPRILVSAVEHAAVREPAASLRRRGIGVHEIAVDGEGRLDMAQLVAQLTPGVRLVSVMAANNETGVLQDIPAIAERVHAAGALLHCDAIQWAGKLDLAPITRAADLVSLSAHKLGGPRGVGALIVDKRLDLQPLIAGGGQEGGRRGGTENLPGIVGFGRACEIAAEAREEHAARIGALRDHLESQLAGYPGVTVVARAAPRLPNTSQLLMSKMDGEMAVMALDRAGLAVSSGSACHSGSGRPSHVLLAMGLDEVTARSAVRVSFGRENTEADVVRLLRAIGDLAGAPAVAAGS